MDSKGNVRRVFLACVLHALGWNPAGVQVFRNCASKGHLPMVLLAGEASTGEGFLWTFVRRVFLACVLHALGCFGILLGNVRRVFLFAVFRNCAVQGTFANGFASWRGISRAIELLFYGFQR